MLGSALNPASVAIVGASDNPHKVGGRPILYLQRYGYRGEIYPINPARSTVQGLRAYSSIHETPRAPDLAIVAVAGAEALQAVEACAARGVKVTVVMTSGFGETGAAGRAAANRIHNHEDGSVAGRQQAVDIGGGSGLLHAELREVRAHGSDKLFGIGHSFDFTAAAAVRSMAAQFP